MTNAKTKEFRKIKKIQVRIMEMKMVKLIRVIKVTITVTITLLARCPIMKERHQRKAMKKVNMIMMMTKKDKKRVNGMKRMIVGF